MRHPHHYKQLFSEITIWLVSEIILAVVGLDDIANYSEFLLNQYQASTHSTSLFQYVNHSII
jgi:hypothetical protein